MGKDNSNEQALLNMILEELQQSNQQLTAHGYASINPPRLVC